MSRKGDQNSVVDPELRVQNMQRLRVVDTSIIPEAPTAHTNALSVLIGEKASDLIKETWTEKKRPFLNK